MTRWNYLPPWLLQLLGALLLLFGAGFWAFTGRESVQIFGAAMALLLLGGYRQAQETIKDALKRVPPPDDPEGGT